MFFFEIVGHASCCTVRRCSHNLSREVIEFGVTAFNDSMPSYTFRNSFSESAANTAFPSAVQWAGLRPPTCSLIRNRCVDSQRAMNITSVPSKTAKLAVSWHDCTSSRRIG
jgi:hypothetical protein